MSGMLPAGLILRTATIADAEALAAFNVEMFGDDHWEWTLDFFTGHPAATPDHIFVISTPEGVIVSSAMLIPQRWRYRDVEIGVGQVEAVATRPEYRRQGLVRRLMAAVHARAAHRGLPVQVIDGIPWFYRQFGYTYALDQWVGRRAARSDLTELEAPGSWTIRPATDADLPRIAAIADADRGLVSCPRDEAHWQYELTGRRPGSFARYTIEVIEHAGAVAGVLARSHQSEDAWMELLYCELAPGMPWLDAGPAILRHCHDRRAELKPPFSGLCARLGQAHPLYVACSDVLAHSFDWASWYVRVPDLVGLLRSLVPVLDRRLSGSVADRWTGEVKVNCYTEGVRLVVNKGRIIGVEKLDDLDNLDDAGIVLPRDQLVQLVFGFRDLDTLIAGSNDCWSDDCRSHAVLNTCFPRESSAVWPLG
ncbi:MAG: GNAT family N-acetyltransferase [Egibacteraceae bacterium]